MACKCLKFSKLHSFSEIRQLFVMSHLQIWYLQRKGRELIDMNSVGTKIISHIADMVVIQSRNPQSCTGVLSFPHHS